MSFNVWSMGLFLREIEALEAAGSLAATHLHQVANQTSGEPPAKSTSGSQNAPLTTVHSPPFGNIR